MHVDGASGAFVAPFIDPDLAWDFRLPRVASINASGHKYGLVYPGVGWVVWRDAQALPEDLIFWVNYLGDNMPTFALNFSRPGAQVVAQYYNFLRLGFDGYARCSGYAARGGDAAVGEIEKIGPFRLLTTGDELPVFAFTLDGDHDFTVFDVSDSPARARLAGARLHVPGEPHGPGGAARRRQAAVSATTWPICCWTTSSARCRGWSASPRPCTPRARPGSTTEVNDMCRWIAYTGSPVLIEDLLYTPTNSLIVQSLHARLGVEPTNGDGFGVGWYDSDGPGLFRSTEPAWNDRNLRELAGHVRSAVVVAHVRASTGTAVQQTNSHPFRHGNWLWMHNGAIASFPAVKRELLLAVDPELFPDIEGTTDSELFFYLALTYGLETTRRGRWPVPSG